MSGGARDAERPSAAAAAGADPHAGSDRGAEALALAATPLAAPPAPLAAAAPPRWYGLRDALVAYLPLLMMAMLALGTWWLVKNTPTLDDDRPVLAPRHEPDYTMNAFQVQRFTAQGRLRVQLEGDELRHYPDTDTIEIDNVRIRSIGEDGFVTVATARRALANGDATEVQLRGDARVVREARPGVEAIDFRGEFLHAFLDTEQVRSHLPVTLRRGSTEIRGDALVYDNLAQTLELKGRVRANLPPR